MPRSLIIVLFSLFTTMSHANDFDRHLLQNIEKVVQSAQQDKTIYPITVFFVHVMKSKDSCVIFSISYLTSQREIDETFKPHYYAYLNQDHFIIYKEPNVDIKYLSLFQLQPINSETMAIVMDKLSESQFTGIFPGYEIRNCQKEWIYNRFKNSDVIPIERKSSRFYLDSIEIQIPARLKYTHPR